MPPSDIIATAITRSAASGLSAAVQSYSGWSEETASVTGAAAGASATAAAAGTAAAATRGAARRRSRPSGRRQALAGVAPTSSQPRVPSLKRVPQDSQAAARLDIGTVPQAPQLSERSAEPASLGAPTLRARASTVSE